MRRRLSRSSRANAVFGRSVMQSYLWRQTSIGTTGDWVIAFASCGILIAVKQDDDAIPSVREAHNA